MNYVISIIAPERLEILTDLCEGLGYGGGAHGAYRAEMHDDRAGAALPKRAGADGGVVAWRIGKNTARIAARHCRRTPRSARTARAC